MINAKTFELIDFLKSKNGIGNKASLIKEVQEKFRLMILKVYLDDKAKSFPQGE